MLLPTASLSSRTNPHRCDNSDTPQFKLAAIAAASRSGVCWNDRHGGRFTAIGWPGETNEAVNEMFDCRLAADRDGQHGISANLLELLAIMARARGAITARPMMAGHNMAAAVVTNTVTARATATLAKPRASIIGPIRSASLFPLVSRATGYLRQPGTHDSARQ